MANLLKDIWFRVLHLESRSLRFMWHLFVPGLVSQEFFAGKQRRYPPPVRFFLVITFIFLFPLNHIVGTGSARFSAGESKVAIERSETRPGKPADFYELARKYADAQKMRREIDSLPDTLRTAQVQQALDTLLQRLYGEDLTGFNRILTVADSLEPNNGNSPDSLTLSLGFRKIKMATVDIFQLTPDEIIKKYGFDTWLDKVAVRQGIKSMKEPQTLVKAYLGNLAWTVLALIALMAGLLTLLYWRQNRFYVEHFVFLLNEHSSLFLWLTLAVWVNYFFPLHWWIWGALIAWLAISPYFAFKRFYAQKAGWTFIKASVFSIFYLAGFAALFTLGLLIVFLIF